MRVIWGGLIKVEINGMFFLFQMENWKAIWTFHDNLPVETITATVLLVLTSFQAGSV